MPRRHPPRDRGRTPPPRPEGRDPMPINGVFVREIAGADALKAYRCPGCQGLIPAGTAHVVAWRSRHEDDRRHWHSGCWEARARRTPPAGGM